MPNISSVLGEIHTCMAFTAVIQDPHAVAPSVLEQPPCVQQHPHSAGGRTGDPQGRGSSQLLLFSWYVIMAEFLSVFFYHLVSFIHVILLVLLGSGEE